MTAGADYEPRQTAGSNRARRERLRQHATWHSKPRASWRSEMFGIQKEPSYHKAAVLRDWRYELRLLFLHSDTESPLDRAFARNGWRYTDTDEVRAERHYKNDGWPGTIISTGGGFSIEGKGALRLISNRPEWHKLLGGGGNYDGLAIFLTIMGPDAITNIRRRIKKLREA